MLLKFSADDKSKAITFRLTFDINLKKDYMQNKWIWAWDRYGLLFIQSLDAIKCPFGLNTVKVQQ